MSDKDFELILFAPTATTVREAVAAGIGEFMVDCEWRGKTDRQSGADTDTTFAEIDFVAEVVAVPGAMANCRINGFGEWTGREVEAAIEAGSHRIFLPMARHVDEVEKFIRLVDARAQPAILIETDEAVRIAHQLADLPLAAIYVGLNDLAISRAKPVIFEAVLDGTVDQLREIFAHLPFGFGGVTIAGCGAPIPGDLLLAEMARLHCDFSFLRRSYWRDVQGRDASEEIGKLQARWRSLQGRDSASRQHDHSLLMECIRRLL